mmetsp:Transcript_14600/g.27124  ORF Transcript_14600/g.27124 Transcript_14600/m.27124 type:complete len:356 (+) Transcript_14600:80-1147(+)
MEARNRLTAKAGSRPSSRGKVLTRTSTPQSKKSTVFDRLYKESETSRLQGIILPTQQAESVSQSLLRKNLEGNTKSPSIKVTSTYKPSFIKKKRRTFSNDTDLESFGDRSTLKVPEFDASEIIKLGRNGRKVAPSPAKQLRAVEYLNAEPHKSRLRERLKVAREKSSAKGSASFVSMDLLERSNYWTDKRNKNLKTKRDEEDLKRQIICSFRPKVNRNKSCSRLNKEASPAPFKRRTLSNSYLEIYNIKKNANLSLILGENLYSPSLKISHAKHFSIDFSVQETPHNYKSDQDSVFSTKCSPTPDKVKKDYKALSPSRRLYCFSSGFDIKKFIERSKSPMKQRSLMNLSYLNRSQ